MVILKQPDEIDKARASNRIVAEVLSVLREKVKPGVTTRELDKIAEGVTEKRGARPGVPHDGPGPIPAGQAFREFLRRLPGQHGSGHRYLMTGLS